MNGIEHIMWASRRLRRLCSALLAAIPLVVALSWIYVDKIPVSQLGLPVAPNPGHPWYVFALGFVISMLPNGVLMYAVVVLRRLFGLYEAGVIFGADNVRCYRALGWSAIAWVIAQFVATPLHGLALTINNPPGQRLLTLGLDSNMIMGLFTGAVVLTIAWVMDEGRKIEQEQELYI